MSARRIAAIALAGGLLTGGAGAAIAAVTKDDGKQAEQVILDDAAKRLNVTPEKLREALSAAQDAQLDQAVKDGTLTQKQADAIKARRKQSGCVLGGPPGFRGRGPGPGFGPHRGGIVLDLAKALGITREQLHERLRDGKSVADIAKAQGKSLDDVRAAVKADAKRRAGQAVKDGDLTQAQADQLLSHLVDALDHLGDAPPPMFRHRHRDGPPDMRPGGFAPGAPDEPDLAPSGGVVG
jgi:hypothetical protein